MAYAKIIAAESIASSGLNKKQIFKNAFEGKSSLKPGGLNALMAEDWQTLKKQTPEALHKSKATLLSYTPLKQVLELTGWSQSQIEKCGFIFATTTAEIDQWENIIPFFETVEINSTNKRIVEHQSIGLILEELKDHFNIHGPCALITSSCSASLQALAMASAWIKSGKVDRCIVGSCEILSTLTATGFESLRLLSKEICRPFDKNRVGINLGEASAFIALEKINLSPAPAMAYLSGFGLSSDAYHATSPHPEGLGSQVTIRQALSQAKLKPEDISWFYAHGTGSQANDLAEAKAVENIFTDKIFVSSSKSIHGHTLAASGLLESVLAIEALAQQKVLPNHQYQMADPSFNLNLTKPPTSKIKHILKNSLGFGGINCSVILSHESVHHDAL